MIDNLGGRLGSFDRLEKELPDGRALVGLGPGAGRRRVLRGEGSGLADARQVEGRR